MLDLKITNGTIIDGTGKLKFAGDVGISEGKISSIGNLHGERAKVEINAKGKYVTPGFVDVNNHSDTYCRSHGPDTDCQRRRKQFGNFCAHYQSTSYLLSPNL